jgi:hypothetical protein
MLEQLFDLVHLYSPARRLRLWKISRQHVDTRWSSHHPELKIQIEWIQSYADQERLGAAILQRTLRLKEEKTALLEAAAGDNKLADLPGYGDTARLSILEKGLGELSEAYWVSQQKIGELMARKPRCIRLREWEMTRRRKVRGGKTLAWFEESETCALSAGCCGRDCGCCEKPLRTYSKPKKGRGKREVMIHGHCTLECPCCIRYRGGVYTPHPNINTGGVSALAGNQSVVEEDKMLV